MTKIKVNFSDLKEQLDKLVETKINDINKISDKEKLDLILEKVVSTIWFNDRSDYLNTLYGIKNIILEDNEKLKDLTIDDLYNILNK